jgi:quinol-cytochrome oxidoreductase complex cytochrome b subunit
MKENKNSIGEITDVVFKGVALAMAVAVIVLNILGTLTAATAISMLSIGLFCVALAALQN